MSGSEQKHGVHIYLWKYILDKVVLIKMVLEKLSISVIWKAAFYFSVISLTPLWLNGGDLVEAKSYLDTTVHPSGAACHGSNLNIPSNL